ncbi:MAG: hypothetical protein Q8L34_05585 [Candidatus Woesearchaeota archaeon]|nr:hypothetical protein [Candidatus Woesearchaeota archaeon]
MRMNNKRGQIGSEYIIVVGLILLLAIPFFYSFFRYLLGGYSNQMNADMVVRVSQATETLANLGGVGSKFSVPVRIAKVAQNDLSGNTLSIQTTNGQTYSAHSTSLNTIIGSEALVGDGFMTVPLVYTYLDTIVIGTQPQVVGICPENENPYSSACKTDTTVEPSKGFRILGANFNSNSEVILSKIQGSNGGCQTMTSCQADEACAVGQVCANGICADINPTLTISQEGLIADVGTAQTGVGDYDVSIVNPDGERSTCVSLAVTPSDVQGSYCGDSIVDEDEECDPPMDISEQCIGNKGQNLECMSNCKCKNA